MKIIKTKYLPKDTIAMAIFPFILAREKLSDVTINHERIHLRQQLEMLVIPFYLWYGVECLIRFIQYRNWDEAYRNISFEREAYENENDLNYLEKRKFCSWIKYL